MDCFAPRHGLRTGPSPRPDPDRAAVGARRPPAAPIRTTPPLAELVAGCSITRTDPGPDPVTIWGETVTISKLSPQPQTKTFTADRRCCTHHSTRADMLRSSF